VSLVRAIPSIEPFKDDGMRIFCLTRDKRCDSRFQGRWSAFWPINAMPERFLHNHCVMKSTSESSIRHLESVHRAPALREIYFLAPECQPVLVTFAAGPYFICYRKYSSSRIVMTGSPAGEFGG
jgi:hypothetical protein